MGHGDYLNMDASVPTAVAEEVKRASPDDLPSELFHRSNVKAHPFWQELFSAATMLVPSIYGYIYALSIVHNAIRPAFVWAMVFPTWAHCPVSMAFHVRTAMGHDPFKGRFRTADMSCIHLSFIFFGWALSHGSVVFTISNACLNMFCVALLVRAYLKNERGGIHQMALVGISILVYFSQMLLRGDVVNFAGALASVSIGISFQLLNVRLSHWGHGLFHMMLAPAFYFQINSAAALR